MMYFPTRNLSVFDDICYFWIEITSFLVVIKLFDLIPPIFRVPRKRIAKAFDKGKGKLPLYEMRRQAYDPLFLAKLEKEHLSVSPALLRSSKVDKFAVIYWSGR
jgi:hypothetical protein